MQLSIIIPVFNDAPALRRLLDDLAPVLDADRSVEVVVVDGGSGDAPEAIAKRSGVRFLTSEKGRGAQLAAGIESSQGVVLWLLHADTRLDARVCVQVSGQSNGWGRARLKFMPDSRGMRMVARAMDWRSRLTGICTGDQGMWMTRECLLQAGGIPRQPLMEDIELSRRLKQVAWPKVLPIEVVTSSRRWESQGLWRTILVLWWFRLRYFMGVPADRLARDYAQVRSADRNGWKGR